MPRPGPRRTLVALRISETGLQTIDKLAAAAGRNRSEQVRMMLNYAMQHMPKRWPPKSP